MRQFLLIAPVVALLATGCSIPWSNESSDKQYEAEVQRAEARWKSEQGPSQSDLEESADTIIRLKKQLGKE